MEQCCQFCGEKALQSLRQIVALQQKHDVWDGVHPDTYFFCGTKVSSEGWEQSGTCELRVELAAHAV